MTTRTGRILLGTTLFLGILALVLLAPPDGRERSDLMQGLGRLHMLALHLPITLFLVVPILELAGWSRRRVHLKTSAGFVLELATGAAFVAVILGWLLAWSGGYQGDLLTQHMWGGVMLAGAGLLLCLLRGHFGRLYSVFLVAAVGLLGWTSHQGGSLTHGETFLTAKLPLRLRLLLGGPAPKPALTTSTTLTGEQQEAFFVARVVPILESHCTVCHGAEKQKGRLRLDSYEALMKGGKNGAVVQPGDAMESELFRRIILPPDDDEVMPADGKPLLQPEEVKVIELWIAAGASASATVDTFAEAPALPKPKAMVPVTPDYHPRLAQLEKLEKELHIRLVPRSQMPTDGVILRTASLPKRCDDSVLARLGPVADLIVEAELARTKVNDAGLKSLSTWVHLRRIDLSHTEITSAGLKTLGQLHELESLNVTATKVDEAGVAALRQQLPNLQVYHFEARTGASTSTAVKEANP